MGEVWTRDGTFYGIDPVGEIGPVTYDEKSCRHAIDARRVFAYGGGACTLLVLRNTDSCVELLFHASPETGAVLTVEQAVELAQALTEATY
jgi:hypothetical protein